MKSYAEVGRLRARQIALDASVAVWVAAWAWAGSRVTEVVGRLAGPGESMERAGVDFRRPLVEAGRAAAGLPVVGDAVQDSLEAAAGAGAALERAGAAQVDAVHAVALWLGFLLAIIPISLVLLRYVPGRVRWILEASAAHDLRIGAANLELFALRAVATRPLVELRRATPDPAGALAAGDFERLAAIELAHLGLRPPRAPVSRAT
jgi:hypothetical protein